MGAQGAKTVDGSATDNITENYGAKTYYADGSNWFTLPLLSPSSHTLAPHSAKAHSDLTGAGTDVHHAQSHIRASHTGTEVTANLVAAKGDLLGGSALDTLTRLADGTDGQHLEADSAEATSLNGSLSPVVRTSPLGPSIAPPKALLTTHERR